MSKLCYRCKTGKPASDFNRNAKAKDGLQSACRECEKSIRRAWYENNKESVAVRSKQWKKDNICKARLQRWKRDEREPEKLRARQIFALAKLKGEIVSRPCIICGETRSHGHHPDYSRPLSVIWLCSRHHTDIHKNRFELLPEFAKC